MAHILKREAAVMYQLTVDREERDVLLAALDFARSYLRQAKNDGIASLGQDYPHAPEWYQALIDPIEQVVAMTLGDH